MQKPSRKMNYALAGMTLVLWWWGYCLLANGTHAALTAASRGGEDAAVLSISECHPSIQVCSHIVSVKPSHESPWPTQSEVCSGLNGFFLRLVRKPHLDVALVHASITTWLYPIVDRDHRLLLLALQRDSIDSGDAYLRCCALLI